MAHITTSEGRYYRRQQFQRLIQLVKKEYQQRGVEMSERKIERNLLEKAARDFVEVQSSEREQRLMTSRAQRQELFDKNYKKK